MGKGTSSKKHADPGILSEMTIDQVRQFNTEVVVLGIGSTEPHGPHLPYGTDTCTTEAICRRAVLRANQSGGRVLMYPTLPISTNVNFKGFPFACRIGVRTLMRVVLDIIEALEEDGVRKIVLVNGHGGNSDTLKAAVREHTHHHRLGQGAFVCFIDSWNAVPDQVSGTIEHHSDHAGEYETSQMLHLHPDMVHMDRFEAFPVEQPTLEHLRSGKVYFVRPWHVYLPASAGGETRKSTAEKGEALIEEGANWLAAMLLELSQAPHHHLFPYRPEALDQG